MGAIIYKPYSSKAGKDGVIFLVDQSRLGGDKGPPTITTADGQVITAEYKNNEGSIAQYIFPSSVRSMSNLTLSYGGQTTKLDSGSMRYEGDAIGSLKGSTTGAGTSSAANYPAGFAPGQIGPYGAYPGYLGGLFPKTETSNYDPITAAPYTITDPAEFAKTYAKTANEQYAQNYDTSKKYALDTLNTELQSLQNYVPAAAALKAQQTSLDNIFNQQQRTQQLNQAAPGILPTLKSQLDQANVYAQGRLPSGVEDAALSLNARSAAADQASAGGFGAQSSVAKKASDLMDATQRFQIAQYGNQLQTGNINQQAQIALAPTEYTNAGSQINVMPSQSYSALAGQQQSALNNANMISPTTALQTAVQQNQFVTSNEQNTRQFNASNTLQNNQFNASTINAANQQLFQYQTGYAAALAGAAQTNINAQTSIQQQQQYQQQLQSSIAAARQSGNWQAVAALVTSIFGTAYGSDIVNMIRGNPDAGSTNTGSNTTVVTNSDGSTSTVTTNPDGSTNTTNNDNSGGGGTGGSGTGGSSNNASAYPTSNDNPSTDSTGNTPDVTKVATTSNTGNWAGAPNLGKGVVTPAVAAAVNEHKRAFNVAAPAQSVVHAQTIVHKTLAQAGIYRVQAPGTVHVNTDKNGTQYYANPKDLMNNDTSVGATQVRTILETLAPTGALTKQDQQNLQRMTTKLQDQSFYAKLDAAKAKGDEKAFLRILSQEFLNG